MSDSARSSAVITTTTSNPLPEFENLSGSTLLYNKHFICTLPGFLTLAEIVFGLLVWMPIAGTDYFRVPAFGWVMFVSVVYWVLTAFFFVIHLTSTHSRIPQVPWTLVALFFNGSGALLYLVSAILDATSLPQETRGHHTYDSWAASTFFAYLVAVCYAAHAYLSFKSWKSRDLGDQRP